MNELGLSVALSLVILLEFHATLKPVDPVEIVGHDGAGVDGCLDTDVAECADVLVHHVGGGGAGSHGHEADEVFRFAEIPVEGHAHAVVEESEIKSDVPCGGLLPLEVGIVGTGIEGVGDDVAVGVDILGLW